MSTTTKSDPICAPKERLGPRSMRVSTVQRAQEPPGTRPSGVRGDAPPPPAGLEFPCPLVDLVAPAPRLAELLAGSHDPPGRSQPGSPHRRTPHNLLISLSFCRKPFNTAASAKPVRISRASSGRTPGAARRTPPSHPGAAPERPNAGRSEGARRSPARRAAPSGGARRCSETSG